MSGARAILAVGLALFGMGCIDDLPIVAVVKDTRPIAVRVEVEGEPERAWPRAGETVNVTWLVVDPTESVPVGWGFVACAGTTTPTGLRFCGAEPFDFQIQPLPVPEDPRVSFTLPGAAALEGFEIVLLTGVLCPSGTPALDPVAMTVGCEGATEPEQLVELYIPLAQPDESNLNPSIPDDALTFDGAAWPRPAAPPAPSGCASVAGTPELPLRSVADEDPVLVVTGDQGDRESFVVGGRERREDLVFAAYMTHGEPERFLSVIDDDNATGELDWVLPETDEDIAAISADGTLVRFWWVLIDQRVGAAWTERYACLVP